MQTSSILIVQQPIVSQKSTVLQSSPVKLLLLGLNAIALLLLFTLPVLACGSPYDRNNDWIMMSFATPVAFVNSPWAWVPLLTITLIETVILKWKESLSIGKAFGLAFWANIFYLIALVIGAAFNLLVPILGTSVAGMLMYRAVRPRRDWLKNLPNGLYQFLVGLAFVMLSGIFLACEVLINSTRELSPLSIAFAAIAALGIFFSWLTKTFALRILLHQRPFLSRTVTAMHMYTLWIWPLALFFLHIA